MGVVVMGGTSGIGRASAELFAAEGAEVIVTGRDAARVAAVGKALGDRGRAEVLDGTDGRAVTAFLDRVGEIEHLVLAFSPGSVGFGPLRAGSAEDVRTAFEGKLFAYLDVIRRARVTGSITMVSASGARAAVPGTVVFAAVNGAIERIVSPLAAELAPVRVNAVAPGAIDTPWWSFLPPEQRAKQFDTVASSLPARRIGTSEDVAEAIVYLTHATYVTGSILPVDGGLTVA